MDWDEKTLKIYMDPYPKEGISHQVHRNDGKFMDPNKNLGGSRTVPRVFLFGPPPLLLSRRSHGPTELHFGNASSPSQWHIKGLGLGPSPTRILTNVSPHPSSWGLRSKAAHLWTWYCSNSKELIFLRLFQRISFKEHTL